MIRAAHAVIRIKYSDEREAKATYDAIRPETRTVLRYRTKVSISIDGEYIVLNFEARDTTALRASINSYLSWIMSLKSVYNVLKS